MHIFVTGAAGFIGQATVKELIAHGHSVLGLARNDANASIVTAAGGTPLKGDLKDVDSLRRGAQAADGVVHLAFIHDFSNFEVSCATDRAAIEAFGEVLAGTGKPLILASGTMACPKGELGTEDCVPDRSTPPFALRVLNADRVYELSKEKNIRGIVVRFAPTVHAEGNGGLTRMLIDTYHHAQSQGQGQSQDSQDDQGGSSSAIYVGDGAARWPGCHRDDVAVLLRLALEKGKPGSTYHAVAEEGVSIKDQVTVIAKKMKLTLESKSLEEAVPVLGPLAYLMASDNPASSTKTREELGWAPKGQGLIEDLETNFPY